MAASIVRASLNKFSWFVVLAMALHHHICSVAIAQQVPCFFIFGDSLMDNGNNHQLKTVARADYPPYGIDFPGGPSGRFCNGRTPADVLAELLGFDHYMPPFTVASGLEVLKGVMYSYGARKFALHGLGQIGCCPFKLDGPNGTACVENINDAVQIFNRKLKLLVDQLNQDTPDAKFIYLDTYGIFKGFTVTNEACCGVGKNNALLTCLPFQTPCENRNQYLFWDSFHPTDAANEYVSRRSYRAESPSDAHPYDISRLAEV
ncbi:unnamed protein product [Linum tenue]|uniref:Uncharacterized protein n=1 Tax=Linum tenue TaxID=586396 RepID=A0AAV0PW03_9ROSI|nr:unnamed protein product [Linum tenue]